MLKFMDIVLSDIQILFHERRQKQPAQQATVMSNLTETEQQFQDMQVFFLELLGNYVQFMSYILYEEVFTVFDKLLYLTNETLTEAVLKKCIVALVDKYTVKSKSHKNSINNFMKSLMDVKLRKNLERSRISERRSGPGSPEMEDLNEQDLSGNAYRKDNTFQMTSYFEIMTEFCFFENVDTAYRLLSRQQQHRMIDD